MLLHLVSIYISVLFVLPLPGPKNAGGFSRGKLLGEVCCPVSREWEWNPVFLGLASLPVPRSHPRLGVTIRHRVRTRSDVLACSRSAGFWGFGCTHSTCALLHPYLSSLLLCYITVFLIVLPLQQNFTPTFSMQGTHSHWNSKYLISLKNILPESAVCLPYYIFWLK